MKIYKTKLDKVVKIVPTAYEDFRGFYLETYNKDIYYKAGIKLKFIQDDISRSYKNVLRGIHGDKKTWKLVSCILGTFYLIVVNNDPSSKQFRKWEKFTLSDQNKIQILIPPNFGNGHVVLTDQAIYSYKQTTNYDRKSQFTINWKDPLFKFSWPIEGPILSERDK